MLILFFSVLILKCEEDTDEAHDINFILCPFAGVSVSAGNSTRKRGTRKKYCKKIHEKTPFEGEIKDIFKEKENAYVLKKKRGDIK